MSDVAWISPADQPLAVEPVEPGSVTPAEKKITLQTVAVITLAVLAVLTVLYFAADIVVPLVLAFVLKLVLQPAMRLLSDRLGLPIMLSAFLLIAALFGVVAGIGLSIAVPAAGWAQKLPGVMKTLQEQIELLSVPLTDIQDYLQQAEHMASTGGIRLLLGTQYVLGRLIELVVTLFFMLAAGDTMLRKLVEVVPRFHDKKHVVFITNEIERNVSGYLATITVINLAVGVITGVAVTLCGFSDTLLWGTVVFLLNFIPIVGPLIGIFVIFLVGLLTFGHAAPALIPAAIYLGVHITEGQLVTPMLLARRFTLSPLIVIISLFFWNWMWGVPGALLSVPLLAMFKIVCDRIPSLAPLGHMLGEPNGKSNAES